MTRTELLQIAKPILFNTEMVRAIMDDRKTVTRRLTNPQPILNNGFWELGGAGWSDNISTITPIPCHSLYNRMPYKPGDILYVRETWCWCPCWDCGLNEPEIGCAEPTARMTFDHKKGEYGCIGYKASFAENEQPPGLETWHPSIHMPKESARIFLRVTDVRVERLQEINADGIRNEGLTSMAVHVGDMEIAQAEFALLWDSTIKKSDLDRYSWAANPWVWVIDFAKELYKDT